MKSQVFIKDDKKKLRTINNLNLLKVQKQENQKCQTSKID